MESQQVRRRRPHGSVKAVVAYAHALGKSGPEIVRETGISRFSVYYAARRMSITLRPLKRRHDRGA